MIKKIKSMIQILRVLFYKQNMGFHPLQSQNRSSVSSPPPHHQMPAFLRNQFLFFLILSLNSFHYCFALDVQGKALLSWKNSLNVSENALNSWNSADQSPCNWYGIHCNPNGEVEEVSLKGLNLQGSLPWNFQPLKSLKTLILASTNLSGEIPKEFGEYQELSFVDISDNSLSGTIPVEICKLLKLKSLSVSTNFLEGEIPVEIGNLSSLVYLTLFDNQISGVIPRSIGGLKKLEVFRAGGNKNIKGEIPWEIGNCSNLIMLGLAETSISGSLPVSIGMLKRVQTIAVYTSLLSGPIPEEIGNCSDLQNLYLYQNSISGALPRRIGEMKKLQSLLLWQNSLVGTIPDEIGSCKELKVVDLSENLLTGTIPSSFGSLLKLQELQLSVNQLTGTIPTEISNCLQLNHLEIDNNAVSGEIPSSIGKLRSLTLFFAWQNKLTGIIPDSLSRCSELESLDLSYNYLSGSIPKQIFSLRNLTKFLLLSNDISGFIPPDIGNCTNLYRLRLNQNRLVGQIPSEIGKLKNLNFVDLSQNRIVGTIPPSFSECQNLEYLDLHSNRITGSLPDALPSTLQYLDISDNRLFGPLSPSIGSLSELTKLNLEKNQISGSIPRQILSCSKLQQLNLGDNRFFGEIPEFLGKIPSLAISLNLSCNNFFGKIPNEFSSLTKLGVLDISHNNLTGNLDVLATLQNLVTLNISFNALSGQLPNTAFFKKLPLSDLEANQGLYVSNGGIVTPKNRKGHGKEAVKLVMSILISVTAVLLLVLVYMLVRARLSSNVSEDDHWEVTLYQKLDYFSIDDIVRNLTSSNVIGTGSSGVVYRVTIPNGTTLAVKKMWSSEETGAFASEIQTLGLIRHRNIVRLLGWGSNRNLKLLFYDYLPNGSLSSLLHGVGKGGTDWESRSDVVLGVAHALSYLHHDCVPAILHGDVKAMNVLIGSRYEAYLADFGLARVLKDSNGADHFLKPNQRSSLAGSYGYMAPEHASMQPITEKSDVYSYGVVLLEVLTGRHPLDPTLPGGAHLVQWVRDHLATKQDPVEVLDPKIRGRADPAMHEMLQTLAVSLLCVSTKANDRPTMKDIVAMLKEIQHVEASRPDSDLSKGQQAAVSGPRSPLPPFIAVSQEDSNCSFAFSENSI